MSGQLQTIPARHGVATFVPRGRTIKIINTYGKQVVSTWAFGLAEPPEKGGDNEEVENEEEFKIKAEQLKEEVEEDEDEDENKDENKDKDKQEVEQPEKEFEQPKQDARDVEKQSRESSQEPEKKATKEPQEAEHTSKDIETTKDETKEEHEDPPEQAPDTPVNEKATESTVEGKKPDKRTWSSYLPSIPYRLKASSSNAKSAPDPKLEKAQNEETSKKWSSYIPTGKGFSSYVPNMQVPDSKSVVSAFQASHNRDPNKSYAEQLYDFSKTPVGAGTIAAASGSGTASSIYAAYSAYTKMSPSSNSQPPMEYLSLPHTRAATHRLGPEVNDTLLTNLRTPIMTLVEDTTPGAHDTLTAACDAAFYASLGVDKPEEHGSCAINLVLALKELNETAGLKGTKAVGADITANIAPTPLHLFMNAPLEVDASAKSEGSGAKGGKFSVEEPTGKKRSFVRFRAERDIVVVLSACPMDVGYQNGGKCMAANFMVEEADEEDPTASTTSLKKRKGAPRKLSPGGKKGSEEEKVKRTEPQSEAPKAMPRPRGSPGKIAAVQKSAGKTPSDDSDPPDSVIPETPPGEKKDDITEETPKPKKKPKKLERRAPAKE
ncbi:hypothetical protein K504DRAFT_281152 [Pleomassaria siparia CBS 279.74]|uniref:DUF1989 domain-containing protein n=1 Tax=Pleomassaria siparia CBS 279.74 TaxID=1314801 RepID=A0A6G1KAC3_9PLEO|nr:hypothetical protein K504DRAFT_281152 [Pleomassaria siparia CBS 279.74]